MILDQFDWLPYYTIPVTANGEVIIYTSPKDRYIRPIVMSTTHVGTYNHDAWAWRGAGDAVVKYSTAEMTLNKASPFTLHCFHQDFWLPPLSDWGAFISALTVAGTITPQLYYEYRYFDEPKKPDISDVRIKEQPVKTNPWGWPFG